MVRSHGLRYDAGLSELQRRRIRDARKWKREQLVKIAERKASRRRGVS
jgi:hypothetical protein